MQVASRSSPCAARGRGKRTPENPKITKNANLAKTIDFVEEPLVRRVGRDVLALGGIHRICGPDISKTKQKKKQRYYKKNIMLGACTPQI